MLRHISDVRGMGGGEGLLILMYWVQVGRTSGQKETPIGGENDERVVRNKGNKPGKMTGTRH